MASELFNKRIEEIDPINDAIVESRLAIRQQVKYLLSKHSKIKTQKELAKAMGKEPSEISKWLSGLHNLTHESIIRMEVALGQKILMTDLEGKKKYQMVKNYFLTTDAYSILMAIPTEKTITAESGGFQEMQYSDPQNS